MTIIGRMMKRLLFFESSSSTQTLSFMTLNLKLSRDGKKKLINVLQSKKKRELQVMFVLSALIINVLKTSIRYVLFFI